MRLSRRLPNPGSEGPTSKLKTTGQVLMEFRRCRALQDSNYLRMINAGSFGSVLIKVALCFLLARQGPSYASIGGLFLPWFDCHLICIILFRNSMGGDANIVGSIWQTTHNLCCRNGS